MPIVISTTCRLSDSGWISVGRIVFTIPSGSLLRMMLMPLILGNNREKLRSGIVVQVRTDFHVNRHCQMLHTYAFLMTPCMRMSPGNDTQSILLYMYTQFRSLDKSRHGTLHDLRGPASS